MSEPTVPHAVEARATDPAPFDLAGELPTGTCVLEASAGTGKTYAITALAVRYVAEGRFRLDEMMMVTFSRAATGELRSRVHERLQHSVALLDSCLAGRLPNDMDDVDRHLTSADPDELVLRRDRLLAAADQVDEATIATTHEFCQRMLVALGLLADHDATSVFSDDVGDLARQACQDVWLADELARNDARNPVKESRYANFEKLGTFATLREPDAPLHPVRADGLTERRVEFAQRVRAVFEQRKRRAGVYTFDDMVGRLSDTLLDPLTGPAAVQALSKRYPLVMIDEFQDTDPTQWQIVRTAFVGRSTVILIGDPKQAIYAFRGADVNAYLDAVASADQMWTLPTNHRSDRAVVEGVIDLFGQVAMGSSRIIARPVGTRHQQPRLVPPTPRTAVEVRCVGAGGSSMNRFRAAEAVDDDLVAQVGTMLAGGWRVVDPQRGTSRPLEAHDIAVLVRTNKRGEKIRQALVGAGIAAVFGGASAVMSTPAARDWATVLHALVEPDQAAIKRASLTSLFGWSVVDLAAAVREDHGAHSLPELAVQVKTLSLVLASQGVAAVFEALCEQNHLHEQLLSRPDGERLMTDLRHVCQMLQDVSSRQRLDPAALMDWLDGRIERASSGGDDDRTRRLETDRSCVQVLTVHAAKGLEFPVVLLPEASTQMPQKDDHGPMVTHVDGQRVLDVGVDADRPRRWSEHVAEEQAESLRALYVAMTRAQSRLVMWWAPVKEFRGAPLHRLLNGEREAGGTPSAEVALDPHPARTNRLDARWTSVVMAGEAPPRLPSASVDAPPTLAARRFTRGVDMSWRRTSYSGLTAQVHALPESVGPELVDVADEPEVAEVPVPTTVEPSARAADSGGGPGESPELPVQSMAGLPGGTGFGTLAHAVLEQVDTSASDLDAEVARHVARELPRAALTGVDEQSLCTGLSQVLRTPLGDLAAGASLADIAPRDRLAELDFELPLGSSTRASRLRAIAEALVDDQLTGRDAFAARYGRHLLGSPIADTVLKGFLTGSIDAVLRLGDGRHLVVDYKTNRMPAEQLTVLHYSPEAMAHAMVEAHYPLQALLYSVALHRYLAWRLPGYDPDRHLGGIGYLFVRGMAGPATPVVDGTPCGVFTWRPRTDLVLALSEIVGGRR